MRVHGYGLSDVGNERTNNEDSLLIDDALGLYIVADGMGGHAAGEVASGNAVKVISRYLHENKVAELRSQGIRKLQEIAQMCEAAVQAACKRVWELATSGQGFAGMGTTLTLLMVVETKGVMVHVGDSRLYLVRAGKIHQMSHDHTFTAELVRNGVFTAAQARKSPYAHVLTRALGKSESVQIDTLVFDVLPQDSFLLCSDGLSSYVKSDELVGYLGADDIRPLPQRFIDLALQRGGDDNITAVVVRVGEGEGITVEQQVYCTKVQYQFETLQGVSLLRGLSMTGLVHVMDISEEVDFKAGSIAIQENQPCTGIIIILEGAMSVIKQGFHVTTLGPGDHAGDMSCLRQRPSTATLRAQKDCHCLTIDYESLQRLIRKEPRLGVVLLQNLGEELSDRLDNTTNMLLDMTAMTDTLEGMPSVLLVP